MKTAFLTTILASALAGLSPQTARAQGTMTYLSNLGQPSTGTLAVGSDSWLAAMFQTGTNAGGYMLDSIQLAMTVASGSPSGFTAMLYSNGVAGGVAPGTSLGTLSGSLDPVTTGIYTFTPAPGLMLSPRTPYLIVLTAGTAIADGAYGWSLASASAYNPNGGWFTQGFVWTSSNGSSWPLPARGYPEFAINATGVPEPGVLSLLALGGGFLFWRRLRAKAVPPHSSYTG